MNLRSQVLTLCCLSVLCVSVVEITRAAQSQWAHNAVSATNSRAPEEPNVYSVGVLVYFCALSERDKPERFKRLSSL